MFPVESSGQVLGIDVGYSEERRTTCFCMLSWDHATASLTFSRATSDPAERRTALGKLTRQNPRVASIALDGPLGPSLCLLTDYRSAEALLSQGIMQKRGKPGQTSSPAGRALHQHATELARLALEMCEIEDAIHVEPIHPRRVVEAFPNAFLAALMDEGDFGVLSRNASDAFGNGCPKRGPWTASGMGYYRVELWRAHSAR